MSNVLVVGGAGYIGSHACKALHAHGYTPVVLDNYASGHRHAVQWGPVVEGDVRDPDILSRVFSEYAPIGVMHFAANIEVGEGERDPLSFWDNNVVGPICLVRQMLKSNCHVLVFSSTCATYGEPEALPLTETEPQTPVSVYGRTKLAVEEFLTDTSKATPLRFAALRYFNAAGASEDGEIGEEHDPETHLIPNALKAAMGLGGRMKLFGDDYPTRDGTCVRDYVHVMDLADGHVAALERLVDGQESFACNLGTGHGCTVREILDAVEQVTGRPVPYDIRPRRPGDAAELLADTQRARSLLGFDAKRSSPEKIISDAWNFHVQKWT